MTQLTRSNAKKNKHDMKILFVAATDVEIMGIKNWINLQPSLTFSHNYSFLTTGIGIARATFVATKVLHQQKVDFVIQIGIAGSFHESIKIGDVVNVKSDQFSDLGADTQAGFLSLPQLSIEESDFSVTSFQKTSFSPPPLDDLTEVVGITSDTIHNRDARIEEIKKTIQPDIESMEGAAIMYVCQQMCVPNIQIRAISNLVAPRSENRWNIDIALDSLTNWGINYIIKLEKEIHE